MTLAEKLLRYTAMGAVSLALSVFAIGAVGYADFGLSADDPELRGLLTWVPEGGDEEVCGETACEVGTPGCCDPIH